MLELFAAPGSLNNVLPFLQTPSDLNLDILYGTDYWLYLPQIRDCLVCLHDVVEPHHPDTQFAQVCGPPRPASHGTALYTL